MRSCAIATLVTAFVAVPALGYAVQPPPLDTDWTYTVGENPWPEHPRPLLERPTWQSLNGIWKYRNASAEEVRMAPVNETLTQDVLVPSCLESGLSGVQALNVTYSWWTRDLDVPSEWLKDGRILLNFEAVDYEATIFINGKKALTHTGGYWHFSVDVTEFVNPHITNKLAVFVFDPTDVNTTLYNIPVGKQTRHPDHIFYRSCTGIWQTVWMEHVPNTYISGLDIAAGMDGQVDMTVNVTSCDRARGYHNGSDSVSISVIDADGKEICSHQGPANQALSFVVDSPKLWSPDSPTLYNISVTVGSDEVTSYTGFRTISKGEVDGVVRPLLNGEFFFHFGTLDQGFWPDGIYTPPNREAMVYDLKYLKSLGMNMLRKHIKVEPALFYRACDELGLLLIQDMPCLYPKDSDNVFPTAEQQMEFERQFDILINQHKSYPSIYTWIIYNEGWGQLNDASRPEARMAARAKELDPTRLIDATSGWWDNGVGDYSDNHHYANAQCGTPFYSIRSRPYDPQRIAIQGEFGGIGHNLTIENLWNVEDAIKQINQTYELDADLPTFNYRAHFLLEELRQQTELYACSGAIWTQTTDVEGEVNGLMSYDRRIKRPDVAQWQRDIQALYDTAQARVAGGNATLTMELA
ncbi:putative Beta-galactosidase [Seiridium cardinale]|uniref:Beta-galactosidase n=1 Tax=Seiridium cardinale TaxID=138064 RepID=A0ABR2XL14_9PEZI